MGLKIMSRDGRLALAAAVFASAGLQGVPAVADDTEIYQATLSATGSARPKVLIMVDDSGSMRAVAQEGGEKPPYDPNATYADAGYDNTKIYWSTDNTKPGPGSNNYFAASSNRCESSITPLAVEGNMTTKAKRWSPASGSMQSTTQWVCNGSRFWWWCSPNPPGWEQQTTTQWVGDEAEWLSLSSSDRTPTHVECQADVLGNDDGNGAGQSNGFPYQPSAPDAPDTDAYTANVGDSNISWGNTNYNWYTAHYLNWWADDSILSVEKTRLEVVQEVVAELIDSNPSIDFGLGTFNDNSDGVDRYTNCGGYYCYRTNNEDDHGGRIIHTIIEDMTLADRAAITGPSGLLNDLEHDGWTPLCESSYEAYRYLSGKSPKYGLKQDTQSGSYASRKDYNLDAPNDDTRAINSGTGQYIAPLTDCAYTYLIILTDGEPTYDTDANADIEALTGETCDVYPSDEYVGATNKNCLPTLTKYMANNDLDNDASNGDQLGITYTIGFATDQQLLEDAALNGKGEYFTADSTESLAAAFEGAVFSILSSESSFTSPSVAVNTFTRTQSRNEVFFAMFKPDASKDWPGNIKRLDIKGFTNVDGDIVRKLVDRTEQEAIDDTTGLIKATAQTAWGTGADGPTVNKGGVGELLAETSLTTRRARMLTNTGSGGALETYDQSVFTPEAYGLDILFPGAGPSAAALHQLWDVPGPVELAKSIQWGIGYDTEDVDSDGSVVEARDWIMADILHSRPRVVSYGALGSFTEENPDLRIIVGTNGGFLHMFGNDNGHEDWAFFPKELGAVLTARRLNQAASSRPYGIDSPPVVYTLDVDNDGTLDEADGDKVWVFFGLRRGGRSMYALDISDPDDPEFMWMIDPNTSGYAEIGQTWSVPKIAFIPGHKDVNGKPKPVLVFGGGYDPAKDAYSSLGTDNDNMGRGVFIADAETGDLVWSVTPDDDSSTNMQATELEHSVPANVATLDSNGDDLIDRIYFGDTAGVLWRVDLPGSALPTSSQDTWRLTKVFNAVDPAVTRTQPMDRRFFNEPDIVRIELDGHPGDAILIGTGDRTNPAAVDETHAAGEDAVENAFYMINDLAVLPYNTDFDQSLCATDPSDFRCSLPLQPGDLYDATDNLLGELRAAVEGGDTTKQTQLDNETAAWLGANGWQIRLEREGEKSLSKSVTVAGKVFFGTFTPGVGQANMCEPAPGEGRLYAVSVYDGTQGLDWDHRYVVIGNQIPDTPAIHVDEEGKITIIPPQGGGGTGESDLISTESNIPPPYGSYWYREEY